ncbi:beta-glucosidase [Virgisporangium aliadipatigenens]|uniref:Beta-glucosidase n=1 Tax=Virgisporangium aliadipatigenens TaxID=741659 RepID=A0A8J3YVW5_9ACTN|nr:GH1 family beta-glucosidase [Virgisporangium aliadipatigenens]GIJ51457.1 beta-glucosidase [Virgisporangium aliadipatigenens]
MNLPADFVWGVATSAYQIEGAASADGRGDSVWDVFCREPGRIADGSSGDVACDHYHRWPEDVRLLADLGVDAYRFSVSWTRVFPSGSGPVERRGLDFYQRLVDALCERGISPYVTLFHWDTPQVLEERGGWRNRDTAERFAEYASVVAAALGDRVKNWITLNEPYVSSITGYAEGRYAPGVKEGHGALAAAHHLQLAHGLAVPAVRAAVPDARVGLSLNLSPAVPATDSLADRAAADRQDLLVNRMFTDPILAGRYPDGLTELFSGVSDFGFRRDGDLEAISVPIDFLGVNYYYRIHVADAPLPAERTAFDIGVRTLRPTDVATTDLGWPVEPQGLFDTLTGLAARYPTLPPVYLTENGCADTADGPDDDPGRIAFIAGHLEAVERARAAGVDVRGYFYWSLLDNFEWARGYVARFGLVHVDYATGTRTPKQSFDWYRKAVRG